MKRFLSVVLVTVLATGCAMKTSATTPVLVPLTDGKVLEAVSVSTRAPFSHDLTVQRGRECEIDKRDETGNAVSTKNCNNAYVEKQGGPNIGTVAVESTIDAIAVIGGAATLGALMPAVKISTGGASSTAAGGKASSGSVSTGAVTGSGASVNNTVQNP